nr:ly6/PLAUR domain-containing protein 2-like [Procambarus clarkii]
MKMRSRSVATILVCLAALTPLSEGLWCYQCGTLSEGMSTVNPCFGIKPDDYTLCPAGSNHCKRYSNEGVLVLACVDHCVESHRQTTDITCCNTDGCNAAGVMGLSTTLLLVCVGALGALGLLDTSAH